MIAPIETLPNVISGFSASAGVTAAHLNLLIRSVLCGAFLLWAAWNIYGQVQLIQHREQDIPDFPLSILRVLLLCTWIILLVSI